MKEISFSNYMLFFYILTYFISSNTDITEILIGYWNISSFTLTTDGNEIPQNTYLTLNLSYSDNDNYIYGNINKEITNNDNKELFLIRIDKLQDSVSTFSISVNSKNDTQEYLTLACTLKINVGIDDMMIASGKTSNYTYSLNISPPSFAELTTFDQNTNQIIIYKFQKKVSGRKLSFYHLAPFITAIIYTTIKFLFE